MVEARPLLREVEPVVRRASPMIDCLRSYGPEFTEFFVHWASLVGYNNDRGQTIPRVNLNHYPFGNLATKSAGALTKDYANLDFATLPPPGFFARKPVYRPECGLTPESTRRDWWPAGRAEGSP
jgi:hypothetical protein